MTRPVIKLQKKVKGRKLNHTGHRNHSGLFGAGSLKLLARVTAFVLRTSSADMILPTIRVPA